MTQTKLAREVGCHRETLRKHIRRSKQAHITPEESPLSSRQKTIRLKYAVKNKNTDFAGENITFFDDTFMRLDGTPNR